MDNPYEYCVMAMHSIYTRHGYLVLFTSVGLENLERQRWDYAVDVTLTNWIIADNHHLSQLWKLCCSKK